MFSPDEKLAFVQNSLLNYVWAYGDGPPDDDGERVLARFFFSKHGAIVEDPGTGSACANLGGWLIAQRFELPIACRIDQGEATGRRCTLRLRVDREQGIHVTGKVIEIGGGELRRL